MKRKPLIAAFLACTLIGVSLLGGCGSKGATTEKEAASEKEGKTDATSIEYCFWGNQNEINSIMAMIDKFNETHDDIQVKGIGMDSSVYLQKLSGYASSNTMPDIVQVAMDYGDTYNKKDIFEPLETMINDAGLKNKVHDSLWDGLSYDGHIYGMPLTASAQLLVGNKNLFAEAGIEFPTDSWTEDEFKEAALKMTNPDKGNYGVIWGDAPTSWSLALYGNGENEVYDRDNRKMQATNNLAFKHALDFMVNDIILENKAAPATMNSKDIGGGFETGKYGMATIGFWDIANFNNVVKDSFEWDIIPLPVNEEYGQWKTRIFANALSISKTSENKEAAFEFLKWTFENRDVQTEAVFLAVNNDIAEDPTYLEDFPEGIKPYNKQLAFDALANGCLWQNTGDVSEVNINVIQPEIEKLILKPDSTTLDEVLENIQINGQKVFNANN